MPIISAGCASPGPGRFELVAAAFLAVTAVAARSLGARLDRERLPDLRRRRADDALRRLAARVRQSARPGRPARARARRHPLSPVPLAGRACARLRPAHRGHCSSSPSACSPDARRCRSPSPAPARSRSGSSRTRTRSVTSPSRSRRSSGSSPRATRSADASCAAEPSRRHLRRIRALRDPRHRRARARPEPALGRPRGGARRRRARPPVRAVRARRPLPHARLPLARHRRAAAPRHPRPGVRLAAARRSRRRSRSRSPDCSRAVSAGSRAAVFIVPAARRDRPALDRPDGHLLLLGHAARDRARRRGGRARQPRRDPRVGRAPARARGRDR